MGKLSTQLEHPARKLGWPIGLLLLWITLLIGFSAIKPLRAQVETVEKNPVFGWIGHGRIEGHLALTYSPAGAFSPDSSTIAVVNEDKVSLIDLRSFGVPKVLRPHVDGVVDLKIQSANYLAPDRVLIMASGLLQVKGKGMAPRSPELAFQWETDHDALSGKVDGLGGGGGFGPPRYFPEIRYVVLNKASAFDVWDPATGGGGGITIPPLTQGANLFSFSPDGHWMILAQVKGSSTADPVVVRLKDHQFIDSLQGHQGTVLSLAFSRDSTRVVTACEDGKLRIWSAPDWKLLQTLTGHEGPVHWAEFSPDGKWLISGGEDRTVRIWSVEDGKEIRDLKDSEAPVLTVAFSPDEKFIAASTEQTVLLWERTTE